jgi:hypothetical protein
LQLNRRTALAIGIAALTTSLSRFAVAKGGHQHKNGKTLLGDKIKTDGNHVIEKNGPHTVSVDVRGGKIAGMHVKHDKKGELQVKKYKTSKKLAAAEPAGGFVKVGLIRVQTTDLGTTYIGYSYIDDYGDEVVYWYPYEMILDGDTGAVEYVAI